MGSAAWTSGIPCQAKQKDNVGRPGVDAFEAVINRDQRAEGLLVGFDYSQDALDEIGRSFKHTGRAMVAPTVKQILGRIRT